MIDDLKYVSVSQINTFDDKRGGCNRKWYFSRILKIRKPPSKAMLAGTKIHRDIERYLCGQTNIPDGPEGQFLLKTGQLPPLNQPNLRPEWNFNNMDLEIAGLKVKGICDLAYTTDDWLVIKDWKTKSDFKDLPTVADLLDGVQLYVYSWAGFEVFPTFQQAEVSFVYLLRADAGGPAAQTRTAQIQKDEVFNVVEGRITSVVELMKKAGRKPIGNVRPNFGKDCFKYGRCEYMDECNAIDYHADPLLGHKGETNMAIDLKKLLAKKDAEKAAPAAPAAAPAAPAAAPAPAPAPAPVAAAKPALAPVNNGLLSAAKTMFENGLDGSSVLASANAETKAAYAAFVIESSQQEKVSEAAIHSPIAPPDVAPDDVEDVPDDGTFDDEDGDALTFVTTPAKVRTEIDTFDFKVAGVGAKSIQNIRETLAAQGITTVQGILGFDFQAVPGIGSSGARLLRERVFKTLGLKFDEKAEEIEAPEAQAVQAVQAVQAGPPIEHTRSTKHREDADETPYIRESEGLGYTLCINCVPLAGPFVLLENLLEPLRNEICEELGLPYWDAKPFAEGPKLLGAKVIQNMHIFAGQTIVADDGYEGAKRVLQLLLGNASAVFKG